MVLEVYMDQGIMVQGLEKKRQKVEMVESRGRMIAETSVKKVKEENTTIDLE